MRACAGVCARVCVCVCVCVCASVCVSTHKLMAVIVYIYFSSCIGFLAESSFQGRVQASVDKFLSSDHCKPNTKYHPGETGQAPQGCLWSTHGLKNGVLCGV